MDRLTKTAAASLAVMVVWIACIMPTPFGLGVVVSAQAPPARSAPSWRASTNRWHSMWVSSG